MPGSMPAAASGRREGNPLEIVIASEATEAIHVTP